MKHFSAKSTLCDIDGNLGGMLSHNFLTSLIVKIIERQNPANNQPTKKKKSRKYFTIKKALIRWIIRSSDAHNHVFWHEKSAEGWGKGLHLFFVFFYPPLCVHLLSMGLFIHSAHNCISLSVHNNVMTAIWSKPPEYRDFLVLFLSIVAAKRNAWNNFNAHFN